MRRGQLRHLLTAAARGLWGRRFDLCIWVGGVVVASGIGCVYWPAGVIVAGAGLGYWGVIGARTEALERRKARMG